MKNFILGTFAAMVAAQTQQEREMYPEFTANFDKHGIKWEAVKAKTDDGYILTLMHLLGDADGDWQVTRPSVLYIHGMGGDGTEFTSTLGLNDNAPQAY